MPLTWLALHGFSGCARDYSLIEADLREKGVLLRALSLPGHEGVGPPALSYSLQDVFDRIEANASDEPFGIMAYSMGGRMALHYALHFPHRVARLVLVGSQPGILNPSERAARFASDQALAKHILNIGVDAFLEEWARHPLMATQIRIPMPLQKEMRIGRRGHHPAGLAAALVQFSPAFLPPLWERLSEISCPVDLVVGEEDSKYLLLSKNMAELLPHSKIHIIPKAGHAAHLENKAAFYEALASTLY